MRKKKIVPIILSTLLVACNSNNTTSNNTSTPQSLNKPLSIKSDNKLNDGLYLLKMGSGFDLVSNTATSNQSCLVNAIPSNIVVSNPSAIINFDTNQALSNIQNSLNVDVSGKYGGDRFGMSMQAQFANDSKDNAYTTNIIYMYKYSGIATFNNNLGEGNAALTPTALSLVNDYPVQFRSMCGNSFVSQMDVGITLIVRLNLAFNSHADQERFNASMSASAGLFNVSASIAQAQANSNTNVTYSLSAIQLGGDPQNLNDVFGESDPQGLYPSVKCGAPGSQDSNACNLMISNIIGYAQTLKNQVNKPDGTLNLDKLYYSNPVLSDYISLGINSGAADPTPDILQAMQDLTVNYDKTLYDAQFVNHYLSILGDNLDSTVKLSLQDMSKRLNNQVTTVYLNPVYKVLNCYKGYISAKCIDIDNNVNNALQTYALDDNEAYLLNYLENNSYVANLFTYDGTSFPQVSCAFLPISLPDYNEFAVNCGGVFLNLQNPIYIRYGFGGQTIEIDNLSYHMNNDYIIYPTIISTQDPNFSRYYFNDNVNVYDSSGKLNTSKQFGVTRAYENQA